MKINENINYDFAIIGGGFAGMVCAYILAKEGFKVALLEKNIQLGGSLQIFSRDKKILDTGLHYIGGYDEGQNLNKLFNYFGLKDTLQTVRMNEDGYDYISFNDGRKYAHAMGYENFISSLCKDFPDEEHAINLFCCKIQEYCHRFPLYDLNNNIADGYFSEDLRNENAWEYISSITTNKTLQNVLAGNNMLYAGVKEKTPLFVHALIFNSYICGSYKIVTGGAQLIKQFSKNIRKAGVDIYTHKQVTGATFGTDNKISQLLFDNGDKISAKNYISAIHPNETISLFGAKRFSNAWVKRVSRLEQTISAFLLQITFKPKSFPYLNYNIYHFFNDDVWETINYTEDNWPLGFFVFTPVPLDNSEFAESISIMCYMKSDDVAQWKDSFNTTTHPSERCESYQAFKRQKEEKVLAKLETLFPEIRNAMLNVYSSTPLTFKDYTASTDGSIYGILKNSHSPLASMLQPKTKIPNLWLSGQNIVFHGILGTAISALLTCFEFTDKKELLNKINPEKNHIQT